MGDLSASLDDDSVELNDTPAFANVNVGNGDSNEAISFDLYDATSTLVAGGLWTETLDEYGTVETAVPLPAVLAGTYSLTVVGTTSTNDSVTFTVDQDPLPTTEDTQGDQPTLPTLVAADSGRWRLADLTVGKERVYVFERNPARWTNPNRPNYLEHDVTTAPDGNILAWQGASRSWTFEFSGYLDTQAEYEELEFWSNLRRRFWLIDHRDRVHYVTFDHFDAKARIVPNKPWAHDYTIRVVHFFRQDMSVGGG